MCHRKKSSILYNNRLLFDERITNGCSLLRIFIILGRCKTDHAEKTE